MSDWFQVPAHSLDRGIWLDKHVMVLYLPQTKSLNVLIAICRDIQLAFLLIVLSIIIGKLRHYIIILHTEPIWAFKWFQWCVASTLTFIKTKHRKQTNGNSGWSWLRPTGWLRNQLVDSITALIRDMVKLFSNRNRRALGRVGKFCQWFCPHVVVQSNLRWKSVEVYKLCSTSVSSESLAISSAIKCFYFLLFPLKTGTHQADFKELEATKSDSVVDSRQRVNTPYRLQPTAN